LGNTSERESFLTELPAQTAIGHALLKAAALLLTGHHAQASAVLDHSRALPQGDGRARPAFAGGAEGGERNLIVLDASDVLDDAFTVRCPSIDAEGKVSS
jgi:hypothetical protein